MLNELLLPYPMIHPVNHEIGTIFETETGQFIAERDMMRCVPRAW